MIRKSPLVFLLKKFSLCLILIGVSSGWLAEAHVTDPPDLHTKGIVVKGVGKTFTFKLSGQGTCEAVISAAVLDLAIADITPKGPIQAVSVDFTVTTKAAGNTAIHLSWIGADYPNTPCNELVDDFQILLEVQDTQPEFKSVPPQSGRAGIPITLPILASTKSQDPVTVESLDLPDGAVFDPTTNTLIYTPGEDQRGFQRADFQATLDSDLSQTGLQRIDFAISPANTFALNMLPDGVGGFDLAYPGNGPITIESFQGTQGWSPFGLFQDSRNLVIPILETGGEGATLFRVVNSLPPLYLGPEPLSFNLGIPRGFTSETRLFYDFSEEGGIQLPFINQLSPKFGYFQIPFTADQYPANGIFTWYFEDPSRISECYSRQLIHVDSVPANTQPFISDIPDITVPAGSPSPVIFFNVRDVETLAEILPVSASSSNQDLLPNTSIFLGGSGSARQILVVPIATATSGTAVVTVMVRDESKSSSDTFKVDVGNGEPPTIDTVPNQTLTLGQSSGSIPITIGDDSPPGNLVLSVQSSNQQLIPNANINLGGSGAQRTIHLEPTKNQTGTANIKLRVSDGTYNSETSFHLAVTSGTAASDSDFNGDGRPDLLYQDDSGNLTLWALDAAGNKTTLLNIFPTNVGDPKWHAVGTADFNQDGKPDILFQHEDGTMALWTMNGTDLQSAEFLSPSTPGDPNWKAVGTGDFNMDGKPDIIFQHTDGTLAVWLMDGVNLLSSSFLNPMNHGDPAWKVVGTGDFNMDGKTDLVFQHEDSAINIWLMDGTNLLQAVYPDPYLPGDVNWRVIGTGDTNNDGKTDILFRHADGAVAVWTMNGLKLISASLLTTPENSLGGHLIGP